MHSPFDTDPIQVASGLDIDRRSFARHSARFSLFVYDRTRSKLIGESCDISLGGLRLQSTEAIPPARRYALSIQVLDHGVERPRIEVIARCAWHRATPAKHFEAGFEFVEMTPEARQRIARFIDEVDG